MQVHSNQKNTVTSLSLDQESQLQTVDLTEQLKSQRKTIFYLFEDLMNKIDKSNELLFGTILETVPNKPHMPAIATVHITEDQLYSVYDFIGEFFYNPKKDGKPYRSIAGKCATINSPILISDTDDTNNEHIDDFIILPTLPESKGILAVPVRDQSFQCIAVISISASKAGFLNEDKQKEVEIFADKYAYLIANYINLLENGERKTIPVVCEHDPFLIEHRDYEPCCESIETQIMRLLDTVAKLFEQLHEDRFLVRMKDFLCQLLDGVDNNTRQLILEQLENKVNYFPRLACVVENILNKQKINSRRPPKKFARIWQAVKKQPGRLIAVNDLLNEGFTNTNVANAALWQFEKELENTEFVIERVASFRIVPKARTS